MAGPRDRALQASQQIVEIGTTERVSVGSDGVEGNSSSSWSAISADGRYVGFQSVATNLVPNDTNGVGVDDVFVRDRETGAPVAMHPDDLAILDDEYRPAGAGSVARVQPCILTRTGRTIFQGSGSKSARCRRNLDGAPCLR